MSENENQPVGEVGEVGPVELTEPEAVAEPAESAESAAPAKKPVRRGRIAAVAGSVLLAVAVIGGVGYTVVTVDGADRDAGAPVWKFPKAQAEKARTTSAKGLAGLLVPYGADGWSRGPDIGEFGYDAQLSGAQATALRKESLSGLPRTQRKQLEKQIDKQGIKGIAMRSYVSTDQLSSVYTDRASTVTIQLAQLENKTAVRDISRFQNEFLDALDGFLREGPKIEGHKDARCFLLPKDDELKLDSMYCFADQGDVLVSFTADSAKPMEQKGVAMLFREQLDRIAEPGEAV
ncbi:hypothetical protein [Streptomyces fulvoviolaceus]|uniref:hypothetical protein n=1 Tax=Streptomyces fulvoviolaceus TaxID=285535 RepID=UPI0004CA0725|nr:hypothetical protein [Streptomyces fulvoviolaceus]